MGLPFIPCTMSPSLSPIFRKKELALTLLSANPSAFPSLKWGRTRAWVKSLLIFVRDLSRSDRRTVIVVSRLLGLEAVFLFSLFDEKDSSMVRISSRSPWLLEI